MAKPDMVGEATFSDHIFIGIHGDPGIGKSRFVGTTPGTAKAEILVICAPQSRLDAWLPADKERARKGIIEVARPDDWSGMWELQEYLRDPKAHKYKWVWIDDLSILYQVLLDDVWEDVLAVKPARKQYGLDKGEYGVNMHRIGQWMRHITGPDLFHFGFTAHSEVLTSPDLDSDGDPIAKLMPYVQGKGMSSQVCGYMNVVGFYTKTTVRGGETKRVLRTETSEHYYAGDKFDAFGGRVLDPTMPKIIAKVEAATGRAKPAGGSKPAKSTTTTTARRVVRR